MISVSIILLLVLLAWWRYKISCWLQAAAQSLDDYIFAVEERYRNRYMTYGLYLAIEKTDPIFDISDRESGRGVSPWTLTAFEKMVHAAKECIAAEDQRARLPLDFKADWAASSDDFKRFTQTRLNHLYFGPACEGDLPT